MPIYIIAGRSREEVHSAIAALAEGRDESIVKIETTDAIQCDADNGQTVALDGTPTVFVGTVKW